jgi:hypothetical protein
VHCQIPSPLRIVAQSRRISQYWRKLNLFREGLAFMNQKTKLVVYVVMVVATVAGLSLVSARKTEGVVATAVQVVNTPLSVDTEFSARIPFQQILHINQGAYYNGGLIVAPAGKLLVIDHMSGICYPDEMSGIIPTHVSVTSTLAVPDGAGGTVLEPIIENVPLTYIQPGPTQNAQFSVATRIYTSAGQSFVMSFPGTESDISTCDASVSGYLIKPPA